MGSIAFFRIPLKNHYKINTEKSANTRQGLAAFIHIVTVALFYDVLLLACDTPQSNSL